MRVVTITEAPLAIGELLEVVGGAPVELGPAARSRIRDSRAVVDRALDTGEPIYGLTTGVGHMKDTRLPDEELRQAQRFLVMSHAGGLGRALPAEVVRAAMMVRLNGIARGGSGASPAAPPRRPPTSSSTTSGSSSAASAGTISPEAGSVPARTPRPACLL